MNGGGPRYLQMHSEPQQQTSSMISSLFSFRHTPESTRIFDELPKALIVQVSRPDVADISPLLLHYTIEFQYKQFKWQLRKKASQLLHLHFALKKRAFFEDIHEKQEQVKEWLQNLGIGDHTTVVQEDDEADEVTFPIHQEESARNR